MYHPRVIDPIRIGGYSTRETFILDYTDISPKALKILVRVPTLFLTVNGESKLRVIAHQQALSVRNSFVNVMTC